MTKINNSELYEKLLAFKDITVKLMECLEQEEYDNFVEFLENRQAVIEEINNLKYSQDEFKTLSNELQLLTVEKKLNELYHEKRNSLRLELDKMSSVKNANKNYTKQHQVDSIFFNKKI